MRSAASISISLNWFQRAAREFTFEICIALVAGDELAENFADAAMAAGELDHAIGERRAPEVSVKLAPHLRGALQFFAKVSAPALFISERRAGEIRSGEEFRRAQCVIDAFTRDGIGKTGRVT